MRCSALLLLSIFYIAGCSGSSDSASTADIPNDADTGSTPVNSNPVIPDPLVQIRTRVDFEISVPAYQSDALAVSLIWGDKTMTAMWVGDELWSASDEFPSNTENPLQVTFFDDNGGIILGRYDTTFRTGSNDLEMYQITADQFETSSWDNDGDGDSNLDELIAGANPFEDEQLLFDIRESYEAGSLALSTSRLYEANIPTDRPYYEHQEIPPDFSGSTFTIDTKTIEIDTSGNGTYQDRYSLSGASGYGSSESGTRTYTGSSVIWSGRSSSFDSGAGRRSGTNFTTETTYIDDLSRRQEGSIEVDNCCGPIFDQKAELSYAFVGNVIEGTSECEPVTGTFENKYTSPRGSTFTEQNTTTITVTKEVGDRYWAVSIASPNNAIEEYLVRTLEANFYCDFLELKSN